VSFPPSAFRSASNWLTTDLSSGPKDQRRHGYAIGVVVLLVGIVIAYFVYGNIGSHHHQYDLKIYYHAVKFWLDGNSLYDYAQPDLVNMSLGYTYPPIAALAMVPMTLLPLGAVIVITFLAIVAANTALTRLFLVERLTLPPFQMMIVTGLVTAASFDLQPIGLNIAFGQINVFLALLVVVDILVLGRRGSRWFGVGIGIAMAIKLTPGIFLVYLVLSKRWRAMAVAVLTAAAAIGLAAVFAPSDTVRYYTRLVWESDRLGFLETTMNQSINGLLARLASPDNPSRAVWLACCLVVSVLGIWRIRTAVAAKDTLAAITLTGFLGVLVSPVSWLHHIIWVVPAAVLLAAYFVHWRDERAAGSQPSLRRLVPLVVLALTGAFVWFVNTRLMFVLPETEYYRLGLVKIFQASLQCIWTVAALLMLPIRRSAPAAAVHTATDSAPSAEGRRRSG